MPTSYPGSNDTFQVPSSPGSTPLSSPGDSGRNHVQLLEDIGDAVEALQANATQTTHSHSGTGINGPKLSQSNTHQGADTDTGPTSIHHTLGAGANQAAAGNHNHDTTYVNFASTQSITGKKTFSAVDAAAVAIPNFFNSQHNHSDARGGGVVPVAGTAWRGTLYRSASVSYSGVAVGETLDFYPSMGNSFDIPANIAVHGEFYISYRTDRIKPPGDTNAWARQTHVMIGVGWNQPADANIWVPAKGATMYGVGYNGANFVDYYYRFGEEEINNQVARHYLTVPFEIAATGADRTGVRLSGRFFNIASLPVQAVRTGTKLNFVAAIPLNSTAQVQGLNG